MHYLKGEGMKIKRLTIVLLGFLMLSGVLFASASAAPWPNLPTTAVTLNVVPGTTTYFLSTLSGVGAGYDVHNGIYPGWCIDAYTSMTGSDHSVKLYSSLSGSLPAAVSSMNWNKINYILNHKQGNLPRGQDVQDAIWYFTNGINPSSSVAQAMITAANANSGFVPQSGQIMAVILVKSNSEDTNTQNTIIELTVSGLGLSPGYWKHNVAVYCGTNKGSYSGDPHITPAQLEAYAAWIRANIPGQSGFNLAWANNQFRNNAYKGNWLTIANWFNAAAGLQPYSGD